MPGSSPGMTNAYNATGTRIYPNAASANYAETTGEGLAPAKDCVPLGRALFTSWRMVETAATIAT